MHLEEHADASAFLAAAGSVLDADEARHNLIFGICSTLIDAPDAYPGAQFWTVRDGAVVAAAVMTSPFNVVVAQPRGEEALPFLAHALHERATQLPGVTGATPEVDAFAEAWESLTGAGRHTRMSQGIYAARAVKFPSGVSGEPRAARLEDRDLVVDWAHAFEAEALDEDAPRGDVAQAVERRLRSATSGFALWMNGRDPVSICGYGGRTPHGIRISPVYTPPEHRGRGYGSAVTAHVTAEQLAAGREYCFLYTDLTNPTSNKIYVDIGYERVCDSADYVFEYA